MCGYVPDAYTDADARVQALRLWLLLIKKKKNAYALHYVSKTQAPCIHPISGTDATQAVANTHGMGEGELRLILTLNGRQLPSALAKYGRQLLSCLSGDTSSLPESLPFPATLIETK